MTLFAKPAKKKDDYKGKKMPGKKCIDTAMGWEMPEAYKSHGHPNFIVTKEDYWCPPSFTDVGAESNIPACPVGTTTTTAGSITLNQGQNLIKTTSVNIHTDRIEIIRINDDSTKPVTIVMPDDWIWQRTANNGIMALTFSPPTSAVEKTQSTPQSSEARKSWIKDLEVVAARVKAYQEQVSLKEKDLLLDRKEDY